MEKKRVKVYLAFPVNDYNDRECRQAAVRLSTELMFRHDGWQVVNPFHIYDRLKGAKLAAGRFEDPDTESVRSACLYILSTCDMAYFALGWQEQPGGHAELKQCREYGVDIVLDTENVVK